MLQLNFLALSPFNLEAYDHHAKYDSPAPLYDEESCSDSSIITISPYEAESQELDHSSSVTGIDQSPLGDESLGLSCSISEERGSCNNKYSSTGLRNDCSLNNCVIVGYVKPLTERTPEPIDLSWTLSHQSVKRKGKICSDSEASSSLLYSSIYSENVGRCKSCSSPAVKKKDDKNKCEVEDLSSQDLSWSPSSGSDTMWSPCNHRLCRKGKSLSPQSYSQHSQGGHGHRTTKEHHGKGQLKRR
ncbi:LOW QUALITY PROTEIN: hypothetical protein QYF61_010876 [Mycteria americana]|uniref:RING-type E3 ubiquitin transferase n=1 Tax=Mycteria americana TaxID=33587 RepID=A0AAN7NRY0_MYCAM|nr:LOW QUALITY PROTEIN: hypothetical protein QYF61_010876 [Mycteria americana]